MTRKRGRAAPIGGDGTSGLGHAKMQPMGSSRRLFVVLLAGLTFTLGGGLFMKQTAKPFKENPLLATAAIPVTTTTTAPPAPVTTLVPPAARSSKPVTPPRNSYAPEPITKIGVIEIPKIGLLHDIYHGISLRNIDNGPSHWPGTAFPGEPGNAVFAGHRVTHSHPFRNIDQLVPGDTVIFHIQGMKSTYSVTGSQVVTPDTLSIVNQTETPTATLFACHPPGSAKYRYVVHLALVDVSTDG